MKVAAECQICLETFNSSNTTHIRWIEISQQITCKSEPSGQSQKNPRIPFKPNYNMKYRCKHEKIINLLIFFMHFDRSTPESPEKCKEKDIGQIVFSYIWNILRIYMHIHAISPLLSWFVNTRRASKLAQTPPTSYIYCNA